MGRKGSRLQCNRNFYLEHSVSLIHCHEHVRLSFLGLHLGLGIRGSLSLRHTRFRIGSPTICCEFFSFSHKIWGNFVLQKLKMGWRRDLDFVAKSRRWGHDSRNFRENEAYTVFLGSVFRLHSAGTFVCVSIPRTYTEKFACNVGLQKSFKFCEEHTEGSKDGYNQTIHVRIHLCCTPWTWSKIPSE